jgi:hypothetical protein
MLVRVHLQYKGFKDPYPPAIQTRFCKYVIFLEVTFWPIKVTEIVYYKQLIPGKFICFCSKVIVCYEKCWNVFKKSEEWWKIIDLNVFYIRLTRVKVIVVWDLTYEQCVIKASESVIYQVDWRTTF